MRCVVSAGRGGQPPTAAGACAVLWKPPRIERTNTAAAPIILRTLAMLPPPGKVESWRPGRDGFRSGEGGDVSAVARRSAWADRDSEFAAAVAGRRRRRAKRARSRPHPLTLPLPVLVVFGAVCVAGVGGGPGPCGVLGAGRPPLPHPP